MLKLARWMSELSNWVSAAVARLFSPTDDAYPTIGVQPFSGDPTGDGDW